MRLLQRPQALWRRRGPGIASGDSNRRVRFTPGVACKRFVRGGEPAFLTVEVLVNVVIAFSWHMCFARACATQNLALNPIHGDQPARRGSRDIVAPEEVVKHAGGGRVRRLRRQRARYAALGLRRSGQPWQGTRSGPDAVTVGALARCWLAQGRLIHLEVTNCAVATQHAMSGTGGELHHLGAARPRKKPNASRSARSQGEEC